MEIERSRIDPDPNRPLARQVVALAVQSRLRDVDASPVLDLLDDAAFRAALTAGHEATEAHWRIGYVNAYVLAVTCAVPPPLTAVTRAHPEIRTHSQPPTKNSRMRQPHPSSGKK